MDQDANLAEQLELASHLIWAIDNDKDVSPIKAARLAELVIALNEWITSGGAWPRAWAPGAST